MKFMVNQYAAIVPGDPAKAARNIIKLVTKPGPPLGFVVGDDALVSFKAFYEKRLQEMEAARELSAEHGYEL